MTYELVLKLKESGFPQKIVSCNCCEFVEWYDESECVWNSMELKFDGWEDKIYIPTLLEMIKACNSNGNTFTGLHHDISLPENNWKATAFNNSKDIYRYYMSSNPEQTVAGLWLALNEK